MYVSVGDVRLFVDVDGAKLVPDGSGMRERPTIVLAHGSGGDHTPFKEDYAELTDFAQVVYYDHRGSGRSDAGGRDSWTLDQWADDLRALCEALGIEHPVVVGSSFGGVVALNYAIRHPDHPAKLVLVSTASTLNVERSCEMYERLGGTDVRQVAERFYADPIAHRDEYRRVCGPYVSRGPRRPEVVARMAMQDAASAHFLGEEFFRFDFSPLVNRIRCPALLIAGELDPIVTIEDVEELAAALPSELVLLCRFPDAGHGLAGDQRALVGLVRDFVLD